MHHNDDVIDRFTAACDQLPARDLGLLDEARLRADVEQLTRAAAQVAAERLRCVAEIAGRSGDAPAGVEAARRLLRTAGKLSGGQAARQARLAIGLGDARLGVTAAALATGQISPDQADALAQALRTHPELVAQAQDELVGLAAGMDDRAFRQLLADRRHAADSQPEQQKACDQYAARGVTLSDRADGMTRIEGWLTPDDGAWVRTALDALAGPDPATVPGEQRRTPAQRNADALVQLAKMALAHRGDLPAVAGLQPTVTVFVTPETLADEPDAPAARMGWAGVVSGATVRRVACDADVVRRRVTQGGRTVWVDVRRHPSPAQRLAVIERDRTCRFTTPDGVRCERPWQWCDIHRPRQPPPPAPEKERWWADDPAQPDAGLQSPPPCGARRRVEGHRRRRPHSHLPPPPVDQSHQPGAARGCRPRPAQAARPAARPGSGHQDRPGGNRQRAAATGTDPGATSNGQQPPRQTRGQPPASGSHWDRPGGSGSGVVSVTGRSRS